MVVAMGEELKTLNLAFEKAKEEYPELDYLGFLRGWQARDAEFQRMEDAWRTEVEKVRRSFKIVPGKGLRSKHVR